MTMLAVQSLLLIMAAFFAGAMTACFLRRVLFVADNERPNPNGGGRVEQQSTSDVVTTTTTYTTKTTTVSANDTSRFARALTGPGGARAAAAVDRQRSQTTSSSTQVPSTPPAGSDDTSVGPRDTSRTNAGDQAPPLKTGPLLPASYPTSAESAKAVAVTAATVAASAATISATAGTTPANDDVVISKAEPDDLTLIRPITPSIEQRLNADGVTTFADIGNWRAPDVAAYNKTFGYVGRIEKENWIEQAAVLSKGKRTYFAGQQSAHDAPVRFDMWSLPARSPSSELSDKTLTADEEAWARDEIVHVAVEPKTLDKIEAIDDRSHTSDDVVTAGDDAQTLVGAALAANAARTIIETAASETVVQDDVEVASIQTSGEDIERNIGREAHDLAPRSPASDPLPVDVPTQDPRSAPLSSGTDVAGLRSVRSEALIGQDTQRVGDASNVLPLPTAASGMPDDLKRIRGIGVLIEKKLNAMGVRSYQQIANWTAADVARVSETLDFKGRIERESWIEQARILSSGGYTEFSRRSS